MTKANRAGLDVGTVQSFVSVKTRRTRVSLCVLSHPSCRCRSASHLHPLHCLSLLGTTTVWRSGLCFVVLFCFFFFCWFNLEGGGVNPWASVSTLRFSRQILKKEEAIPWPGTLAIVHSYIAYKEGESDQSRPPPSPQRKPPKRSAVSPSLPLSLLQLKKRRNRS